MLANNWPRRQTGTNAKSTASPTDHQHGLPKKEEKKEIQKEIKKSSDDFDTKNIKVEKIAEGISKIKDVAWCSG